MIISEAITAFKSAIDFGPKRHLTPIKHRDAVLGMMHPVNTLMKLSVISREIILSPANPGDGDRYIVGAEATGAWSGNDGKIAAWQDAAWVFYEPQPGWTCWVVDEKKRVLWNGDFWDFTTIISKLTASDTASLLFQDNGSGRAEIGLIGTDDFKCKVSPDGSTWLEAFNVSRGTGSVAFNYRIGVGNVVPEQAFHAKSDLIYQPQLLLESQYDGPTGPYWSSRKSRLGAAVHVGDQLGTFVFQGFDINNLRKNCSYFASAAETVGDGFVAARMSFNTVNNSGVAGDRMRITADGNIKIGSGFPTAKLHVDGPVRIGSYTVATVPSASSTGAGAMIYVSNESGGAVTAFSDGTSWRRMTDRAIIS